MEKNREGEKFVHILPKVGDLCIDFLFFKTEAYKQFNANTFQCIVRLFVVCECLQYTLGG